jgi:hypothetical protein
MFQSLPFKCNLQRYSKVRTVEADYWCYAYHHVNGFEAGLHKLHSVYP